MRRCSQIRARQKEKRAVRKKRSITMQSTKRSIAFFMLQSVLFIQTASAQCENKSGFAKQACEVQAASGAPSNSQLTPSLLDPSKGPALTTGFSDMIHLDTLPAAVDPKAFAPLDKLDRTDDGSFVLKAGIFEANLQSYSLEPGDAGNNRTAGFFPAPIRGRKANVVAAVLKQTELHPDVPQNDIQQLLWEVVRGTDLEKMTPGIQQTAARILPHDALVQLQGPVQAEAAKKALMTWLDKKISKSPVVQQGVSAANTVKSIAEPNPAGAGVALQSQSTPGQFAARGTWAQMPGGFFVRYLPEGAAKTRLQVIVPDAAIAQADPKNPLVFDPTQFLAVYTQAPLMRLGVTMRPVR
jgi:hypothetical protein